MQLTVLVDNNTLIDRYYLGEPGVAYYLEDGDFVKLSNLTIGYTLPIRNNKYMKSLRVYVSGNNLFCITGYSGLDPELDISNVQAPGVEYRDTYPTTRSFTFGVNIGF